MKLIKSYVFKIYKNYWEIIEIESLKKQRVLWILHFYKLISTEDQTECYRRVNVMLFIQLKNLVKT